MEDVKDVTRSVPWAYSWNGDRENKFRIFVRNVWKCEQLNTGMWGLR
jgi:hypothetical protein